MAELCFWTDLVNATQTCVQSEEEEMKYLACFSDTYAWDENGKINFQLGGGCQQTDSFIIPCDPEQISIVDNIDLTKLSIIDGVMYSIASTPDNVISVSGANAGMYKKPITEDMSGYVLHPGPVTYEALYNALAYVSFPRPGEYVSDEMPTFYIRLKFTYPGIDGFVYFNTYSSVLLY